MTDDEANALRCIASEIICKLHTAGQFIQLTVLSKTASRACEMLEDSGTLDPITRKGKDHS